MSWRHHFLALAFLGGTVLLGYRVVDLMVVQRPLLQAEAAKRSDRMERMPARRGVIRDRWGEPLAISTPVYKIFAEPKYMKANAVVKPAQARALAQVLALDGDDLERRLNDRRIGYTLLARQVEWNAAQRVRALEVPGVRLETTYRRYYPAGEVAVQVVGFMGQVRDADSDRESLAPVEEGRGGIELAFNDRLRMRPGVRRVVRDRDSHNIDDLGVVTPPKDGEDVTLSIDLRLQYQAYRELKAACAGHDAASGSLVMLDARTGEILALANQPSLNPNQPLPADLAGLANAAIIAPLEPGSTAKPFTAIAGLESGKFSPDSEFDTNPGYFQAGRLPVKDPVNYRTLSLTGVLKKSSQVGIVKLAMQLDRDATYSVLKRVGFGSRTGSGLPAEHSGLLDARRLEREVDRLTWAYGYGFSVTPLQLARAYLTLARAGNRPELSILRVDSPPAGEQVIDPTIARTMISMLEAVTEDAGTGHGASIAGYRVAGKTGTARIYARNRGYDENNHSALFAGLVPAENPAIVMVVILNQPSKGVSGGGAVAAPVFARVAERSLRLLGIPRLPSPGTEESDTRLLASRGMQ